MKNRIFMYLFVFAMLFVVFQYVNAKHILDNYEEQITKCDTRSETYKDSIAVLLKENSELKYLNVRNNDSLRSFQ